MPSVSEPFLPLAMLFERIPPDREALIHGEERWTFGQLDARSADLACWLVSQGVVADDLVAFALPNGPEFLALTFAIYRAGATPAPLSPKLPEAECEAILATMQPRCMVDASALHGAQTAVATLPQPHIAASWKACTSGGSTGRPKVIVDGRPAGFPAGTDFIAIPENSRVLVPGPLYHNAPFSAAVFALWRGNAVVTVPRFDATEALALIAGERLEWALMVPTMMHRIMALPPITTDLTCWKTVVHTAAPMAAWLKHDWIARFGPDHVWEVYGATEGLVRSWIGGREWLERPGSVGRPLGGGRIRITGTSGAELPAGELGEIYAMPASGPRTTYRYIGAERRIDADGWESVGDVGRVDAEGYLFLADRKDDLIICGGVNVWPAEVEAALLAHPAIRSCAVHGVPHADLGMTVHSVIESSEPLQLDEIGAFLATRLARAKHPRSIALTTAPVRDDAGKFRKPGSIGQANPEETA